MATLIHGLHDATPEILTAVLRESGHLPHGQVVEVKRDHSLSGVSIVTPLKLRYSDDAPPSAPTRLILKLPRLGTERGSEKEVCFYRSIGNQMAGLPVIRCYSAESSPQYDTFHLLLEDLSETHDHHIPAPIPPRLVYCEQIVDALAKIHALWWDNPRLEGEIGRPLSEADLLGDTPRDGRAWAEMALPAFLDYLGDRISAQRERIYERAMVDYWPKLIARLTTNRNLTLIHGDPHIGNFLYPRDTAADTVRVLDWKSWAVDMGADDLAHMMALFWFPERRARLERPLLRRYHDRLVEYGVRGYGWDDLWRDYRLSVVRYLFHPMWQWERGTPMDIWWNHLERIFLAFEDLACEELRLEG